MHFNLEHDWGDQIACYLVPDGYSATSTVRVESEGKVILILPVDELREHVRATGRHETGRCGFTITTEMIPDLRERQDIAIYDEGSGLLVYRRARPNFIPKKIFRLESSLFPLWKLDEMFKQNFQYFARGIERYGRETTTQMLELFAVESIYLSGRIQYKSFAYLLAEKFETIVLMQDPHEDFVERLAVLSKVGNMGREFLGDRDAERLAPALSFAANLPFEDPRQFARAISRMPTEVAMLFSDPFVRLVSSSTPDEMPTGTSVASALDLLANCTLVGIRQDQEYFRQALGSLLNIDPYSVPEFPNLPQVPRLAAQLRTSRMADHLIARDLELFSILVANYMKVRSGP